MSETEETERFEMFKKNLVHIDALNRQNPLAKFGITMATDMTEEEKVSHSVTQSLSRLLAHVVSPPARPPVRPPVRHCVCAFVRKYAPE